MTHKVGFIGLGQMGKWMALNLLKAGFDLTVFDINANVCVTLEQRGASIAQSPAEMADRTDWIFLSLPDAARVEQVVGGEKGVAEGAHSGLIVADCGTSDYLWTIDFEKRLTGSGLRFVDAPVTGMEQRARDASLTIMFGGDSAVLSTLRPALIAMGNKIVHMGGVGSGQIAKLVNQLVFNANLAVLAEVLPMAAALGLDPDKISEVINTGSGSSFASKTFIPNILNGRFDAGYSMENAYKDMAGALTISAANQIPMPMVQTATMIYQMALCNGLGPQDKGAMIKIFEQLLQVAFRQADKSCPSN